MDHYAAVVQALQTLAARCDGAVSEDNAGFNKRDSAFGKSLAEQSLTRTLSPKQISTALKMLQIYRHQLARCGVTLPTITEYYTAPTPTVVGRAVCTAPAPAPVKRPVVNFQADGKDVVLSFAYNPQLVETVKALPIRRYDTTTKSWRIPLEHVELAESKLADFAALEMEPSVTTAQARSATLKAASCAAEGQISINGLGGTLLPFQAAGVRFVDMVGGRALIGDDMGLGKTIQALAYLQLHPDLRPAVIVVPASLKLNWRREIEKWVSSRNSVSVVVGKKGDIAPAEIYIVNYDLCDAYKHWFAALSPAVLVLDEAHYAKNPKSLRTKAVQHIAKYSDKVLLMTGTAILNRPIELFPLLNMLAPTEWPSFMQFAKRYCGAQKKYIGRGKSVWDFSGATNIAELHDRLKGRMIRRTKGQVLTDLPPKRRVVVPVEMTDKGRKAYDAVMEEVMLKIDGGTEAEHLVLLEGSKQAAVAGKLDYAIAWAEDFIEAEKLVLFVTHKFVAAAFMEHFGAQAVKITGDSTMQERDDAVQRFQTDDTCRLFVGNIQAAGVGITLTAASNVAFVELAWRPGDQSQAEDRCHRIGQTGSVTAWYLLAENTVEEDIFELLEKKRQVVESVLDGRVSDFAFDRQGVLGELVKRLTKQKEIA